MKEFRSSFQAHKELSKSSVSFKQATAKLGDMQSMLKAREISGIVGRAKFNIA